MIPLIVKRYLIAFDRHKWAGITGFAVVLGLSGFAAIQPEGPFSYVSEGIMVYVEPPLTFSTTVATLQEQGQSLNEARLLSDNVVEFVSQQLAEQEINLSAEEIRRNTTVEVNSESGLQVTVTYQDNKIEQANRVAALLMEAMVEQSRVFNTIQLNRITENLNSLLPQVEQDLMQAEKRLEAYVREEGPLLQAAQDGTLISSITESQSQQRGIKLNLQELEAQLETLQNRLGLTPDQAYTSAAMSADPIIADLRSQLYFTESQLAVLGQRLRPEHPEMLALEDQKQAFEELLQQRVREVIGGNDIAAPLQSTERIRERSSLDPARQALANRLVELQSEQETQQRLLEAQVDLEQELRQEYEELPNKQLEQARLTQEASLKRAFFDQIQARLEDVTLAEKETVGSLVEAQPPQVINGTDQAQNPVVIVLVGSFVGLLVGGGLVVLLDSLDTTFHTLPDLQNALRQQEIPILGLLPKIPRSPNAAIPILTTAESPYLDFFERFRSNLRRAGGTHSPKMVIITSTVAGEGKTFSAYNLAIASALAGKRTLLIEADLRSPSQAHLLDVVPDSIEEQDPLRYYNDSSNMIRTAPKTENLYILPCPTPQQRAAAILESAEMRRTLEDVRVKFDFVILDSPALSRHNDALLLEPYTDGMIVVTRPSYTEEGLMSEVAERFMDSDDIQFLGAVINGAEISISHPEYANFEEEPLTLEQLEKKQSTLHELDSVTQQRKI
ncbi:MAG: AAA family ATPase [Elainellaceae cyanobacterium]